jgi:cyclophilin family peptidyl-prolyl cis-trans isomerase
VPTTKQRRDAARRRLERQIQRRQEAAVRRRRRTVVTAAALGVALVIGAVWFLVAVVGEPDSDSDAAATTPTPTPSVTPAREPKKTDGPCQYAESDATLTNPQAKDVGLPPDPETTPNKGTVPVTMKTNRGTMVLTLDRAKAPCAVQSFLFLTEKKFYDNSPCPRATDQGIFVLQCGDPSGTSQGGPTYQFKQENTANADYSAGVVAMANSGQPNTTGSQFFIIWKDSNQGLGKDYSVVGKITQGLDVAVGVGESGNDGSFPAGGGKPKRAITMQTVRINR